MSSATKSRTSVLVAAGKALHAQLIELERRASLLLHVSSVLVKRGVHLKKCGCCSKEFTFTDWDGAPYLGWQDFKLSAGEMRTCNCGTTLFLVLQRAPVAKV